SMKFLIVAAFLAILFICISLYTVSLSTVSPSTVSLSTVSLSTATTCWTSASPAMCFSGEMPYQTAGYPRYLVGSATPAFAWVLPYRLESEYGSKCLNPESADEHMEPPGTSTEVCARSEPP